MHLTHQTPSALLQSFGLVCCIADGEFIRFEKEKKTSPGYTTKNYPKLPESTKISIFEKSRQLILVWRRKRCQPTSVSAKNKSTIFRERQRFRNAHVENFYFPRGEEKILRRNQIKLRRNWMTPTWKIKNIHVEIWDFPRGYSRKEGIGLFFL